LEEAEEVQDCWTRAGYEQNLTKRRTNNVIKISVIVTKII